MYSLDLSTNINADEELEAKFEELFGPNAEHTDKTFLQNAIENMKIKKFDQSFSKMASEFKRNVRVEKIPSINDIIELELSQFQLSARFLLDLGDFNTSTGGKCFDWINPPGMRTIIYRIVPIVDASTKTRYYDVQQVVYSESTDENTYMQRFYIDMPKKEEELCIFTFSIDGSELYVNMGLLSNNKLKVSQHPTYVDCKAEFTNGPHIGLSTHQSTIPNNELNKELWYDANIDAKIVLIDPVTCEPILRKLYYDKASKKWRSKIKLQPYKMYFAFEITCGNYNAFRKLTFLEQGIYYRFGLYGFSLDEISAIQCLEKDNSPQAWYHIASILLKDGELKNEDLGLEYLNKSANAGCYAAETDLAVWYYFNRPSKIEKAQELIQKSIECGYPPALHIAAYAYETGTVVVQNLEKAFNFYMAASKANYAPSIERLSCINSNYEIPDEADEAKLRESFLKSFASRTGHILFCLGRALLGRVYLGAEFYAMLNAEEYEDASYLCVNANQGAKLIIDAANRGDKSAFLDAAIFLHYEMHGIKSDKAKALKYYSLLSEDCLFAKAQTAIWLLNGIGCKQSNVNDKKAYSLLLDVAAANVDAPLVFETLGRICIEGRGCEVNLLSAEKWLQQAINHGSSDACLDLAMLYQTYVRQGNNEQETLYKKIVQLLQLGAQRGSPECREKLSELSKDTIFNTSVKSKTDNSKTSEDLSQISGKLDAIHELVKQVDNKTEQIQVQMAHLVRFAVQDLQKWLQKEKEDLAPFIQNNNEKAIAAFADKLANYLSIHIHGSDTLIQKETANLQSIFGIIWDRLLPTTQTSLVSAGVLWSYCEDIGNNFDYSGVCISATSALESELKRVFYTGFQEYLYNHYGDPSKLPMDTVFSVWPEKLLNKTKAACQNEFLNPGSSVLGIGNSFTLGTLPYLFWDKDPVNRKLLQQRMKEYLQTIVKDCYADNPLKYINPLIKEGDKTIRDPNSFISQCEQIRENFRNPAAHIDIIPWEKADECYSEVVGKADSFRYATQAKGLIMKLYEFLK